MSKTVKKYTKKLGAITRAERLEEKRNAKRLQKEHREHGVFVKISNQPATWVLKKMEDE